MRCCLSYLFSAWNSAGAWAAADWHATRICWTASAQWTAWCTLCWACWWPSHFPARHRRALIVTEANDIGTAYLRIALLPTASQAPLRDAFHRYVDSRMASYARDNSEEEFNKAFDTSKQIQAEIWKIAVEAGRQPDAPPAANMLLLPAINDMIDITSTRAAALRVHPPWPIFAMLLLTAMVCALLAGNAMLRSRSPNWIHIVGFALITTVTLYVIADLEYPRRGLIQVDALDQMLLDAVK